MLLSNFMRLPAAARSIQNARPNLNKIAGSIPGAGIKGIPAVGSAINDLKTKNQRNLNMLLSHSKENFGIANKAIEATKQAEGWMREQLGYSTDIIGGTLGDTGDFKGWDPMEPPTHKKVEFGSTERKPIEGYTGKNYDAPGEDRSKMKGAGHATIEMKPQKTGHRVGYSRPRIPDIEHFISNYIGNPIYGEPLLSDRFLVAITNPVSAYNPKVIEKFGGPKNQNTIDDITFFACRTTSFPGKELSTYQYTTHGAESDYPYITSYDNIDMSFVCSSASAIERRWFDGWMSSIIDPETMSVGYKDEFSTNISVGILSASPNLFGGGMEVVTAELYGAYPVAMSSIELDHSNSELLEFTITFAYDRWMYKEIVE